MSRIGKAIITIPAGVTITENNGVVTVKGAKGELSQELTAGITIEQKDGELNVNRPSDSKQHKSTSRSIQSVNQQHDCWCKCRFRKET